MRKLLFFLAMISMHCMQGFNNHRNHEPRLSVSSGGLTFTPPGSSSGTRYTQDSPNSGTWHTPFGDVNVTVQHALSHFFRPAPPVIFVQATQQGPTLEQILANKINTTVQQATNQTGLSMNVVRDELATAVRNQSHTSALTMAHIIQSAIHAHLHNDQSPVISAYANHQLIKNLNPDQLGPHRQNLHYFIACSNYFNQSEIQTIAASGIEAIVDYSNTDDPAEKTYYDNYIEHCQRFLTSTQIEEPMVIEPTVSREELTELEQEAIYYVQELDEQDASYDREAKRAEALTASINNMSSSTVQLPLSSEAQGFLAAHSINSQLFAHNHGLAINHQLAREITDLVNQAATAANRYPRAQDYFVTTCDFAQMASLMNYSGKIQPAMQMTDASYNFFDVALAMGKGFSTGCKNIAEFAIHAATAPIETATEIAEGLATAAYCAYVALENWVALTHYMETDLKRYNQQSEKIRNALSTGTQMLSDYYRSHSVPEHVEYATTFLTECFLPAKSSKILKGIHKILGPTFVACTETFRKHAHRLPRKVLRTVMSEAEIYEVASLQDKAKQFMTGLKRTVKNKTAAAYRAIVGPTSLHEAVTATQLIGDFEAMKDIRQVTAFAEITKNFTDLSRLQQHEIAYLNICSWFYPQYLELTKYLETLDLAITYNGQKYPIKSWGLYHSLIGDLPLKNRPASGGHCNYKNMLTNYFKFENTILFKDGFEKTAIKHLRSSSSKNSTLFPKEWSPKKCVQAIVDAIQNPKKVTLKSKNKNPANIGFKITNQNDIDFIIYLNKTTNNLTFFPLKEIP